ncbi:MAG TPA: hypothetical protein VF535_15070 [Allosphingosinicella sp.]|jgi:hypothetical protein
MALFLVVHDEDRAIGHDLRLALDRFELRPGLMLVDSGLDLSPLYHRIKSALPPGSALLVVPLAAAPKFKRMDAGALKWLRARPGAGTPGQQPGSA